MYVQKTIPVYKKLKQIICTKIQSDVCMYVCMYVCQFLTLFCAFMFAPLSMSKVTTSERPFLAAAIRGVERYY